MMEKDKHQHSVQVSPVNSSNNASLDKKCSLAPTETLDKHIDKKLERSICRKLDIHILPLICIMYLFNALDKGNISNAKTNGIDHDLGIEGGKWNLMLSIFYIPFVLFAFPLSLVMKRFNPANVLPILVFTFGSITLLLTSAFNFSGLMAGRWFLGLCESAVLPGVFFYLTQYYRRHELARRVAIIYSFSAIANAFSGLLAFGVFQINNERLRGWQILFMLEGSLTLVVAVCAFLFLPRSIDSAKFFSEEEKEYANYRVTTDSSASRGDSIVFKDAIKVFFHPVTIAWLFVEICIGVPLNSINNWFPQIVGQLGKSPVQTNLFTVPPNVWGALSLLVFAFASDWFRVRSIFLVISVLVTLIGFAVYGAIDPVNQVGTAYFACFLMTTGASSSSVLTSTWYNNNTPNENRRVVISAVGIPLANAAGLISTNIFRPNQAPKYTMALGITAGFGGLAIVVVLTILSYMIFDNRRRNKLQGVNLSYNDVPTDQLREGPSNPNYRWMY
ncbi:high-affinity nicotinic acid transporter [Diutina catenulata]